MLKVIGELAIGCLAAYSVSDAMRKVVQNSEPTLVGAAQDGVALAALAVGSAACFPITAPIGAIKLSCDAYTHRTVIKDTITAVPQICVDKYAELKNRFFPKPVAQPVVKKPRVRKLAVAK